MLGGSFLSCKLKLRVFLTGYTVAMVTYSTEIIITSSPMAGHIHDSNIVISLEKQR